MLVLQIAVLWIVVVPIVTVVALATAGHVLGRRATERSNLAARFLVDAPAGGGRRRVTLRPLWSRARGCEADGRRDRILTHR